MGGEDLSGEVIDRRYQIVERLAEGGMGAVYRGLRIKLDRAVAIKVMHASLPGAMEGRKRFEREAKVMARLEHPHCVSIIDFGIHGDKPYVVMELVRGRSLREVLDEQGQFEIPRAVDVLVQVASGLAHAHEQAIIHRDIKPANIMITPKAPLGVHARILDFGLARMLGANSSVSNGVAVGTPSYMAPEQCRGDQVDARTDIYACGVMLFEMLTGSKPFLAKDPIAIIKQHLDQPPPRLADIAPGSYGALEEVVARALAKRPEQRYSTAVALAEALEAAVDGRTKPANETTAVFSSSAFVPISSSVEIPITEGSSVHDAPVAGAAVTSVLDVPSTRADSPPGDRSDSEPSVQPDPSGETPGHAPLVRSDSSVTPATKDHDSSVRRMLPTSRMRYVVLFGLLGAAAAIAGVIVIRGELADRYGSDAPRDAGATRATISPPVDAAPDPADEIAIKANELAASGQLEAAIKLVVDARPRFPERAVLPLTAGRLYFAKLWWSDGLANLRLAIRLDPSLRTDPDLMKLAVRAFITTPTYDSRLAQFVLDLGEAARPVLDDTARTHPNAEIRARVAALGRRIH